MNFSEINFFFYKAACVLATVILAVLGVKILLDNLFIRGMIALVGAAGFSLLLFQKPSFRTWLQVLIVGMVVYFTIAGMGKI
jgi:hypothetical protein